MAKYAIKKNQPGIYHKLDSDSPFLDDDDYLLMSDKEIKAAHDQWIETMASIPGQDFMDSPFVDEFFKWEDVDGFDDEGGVFRMGDDGIITKVGHNIVHESE